MDCPVTGCDRPHENFAAHARAAITRNDRRQAAVDERRRERYHCDEWCAYRICPHRAALSTAFGSTFPQADRETVNA